MGAGRRGSWRLLAAPQAETTVYIPETPAWCEHPWAPENARWSPDPAQIRWLLRKGGTAPTSSFLAASGLLPGSPGPSTCSRGRALHILSPPWPEGMLQGNAGGPTGKTRETLISASYAHGPVSREVPQEGCHLVASTLSPILSGGGQRGNRPGTLSCSLPL